MKRLKLTTMQAQDVTGKALDRGMPTAERVRESLFSILDQTVLCSIATVTPEGRPHIATAYFSYSDTLDLYFLSHPDSLHCRHLVSHSGMAITVFSSAQQWAEPDQGVQLFGHCHPAAGSNAQEAERSYARRFPAYANWKNSPNRDDLAGQYQFYRFRVTALKLLDESNLGDAVFFQAEVERE